MTASLSALLCAGLGALAGGVGDLFYRWEQGVRRKFLVGAFDGLTTATSKHFVLHYDARLDSAWAPLVLAEAENAREAVVSRVSFGPAGTLALEDKVPLLLYPDEGSLQRQFRPGTGFRAIGAYWCGVIQVLTPRSWLAPEPPADAARQLRTKGPLIHEYSHYALDRLVPRGRYPRWLSEGLAQYVEFCETGYFWHEDSNDIETPVEPGSLYRLSELDGRLDGLANVALAYREAFLLVAYLVEAYGPEVVGRLIAEMSSSAAGFEAALGRETGLSSQELERVWLEWLEANVTRFS